MAQYVRKGMFPDKKLMPLSPTLTNVTYKLHLTIEDNALTNPLHAV